MRLLALALVLVVPASSFAAKGPLKGHAAIGGLGPVKRITIYNDGTVNWTHCELRLPTNQHYLMDTLRGHDQDGIMITRFTQDGAALDKPLDALTVKCDQGSGKFAFSL